MLLILFEILKLPRDSFKHFRCQLYNIFSSFCSGLDVNVLLEKLYLADKVPAFAENASTFIIAYAVHKVFAPVRITITVTSTPFIVRYLRKKKILK